MKPEVIHQMKAPKDKKRQESSTEVSGNCQLFEALLSQVDDTIRTTQTAASGRNGMDLGL